MLKWKNLLALILMTLACVLPTAPQYDETAKRFHAFPLFSVS